MNIFIKIIPVVALGASLVGCASVSTPMKHADGRVLNCSASGFGWIGAPAALIMRRNCVMEAEENGFSPVGEIRVEPATKRVAYSGDIKIVLPNGWVREAPPAKVDPKSDYAKNVTFDAYMILSSVGRNEVTDVGLYAESKKSAQISRLRDTNVSETTSSLLKGRLMYSTEVIGALPETGVRLHFHNVVVDAGAEVLVLTAWTTEANYSGKAKEQIEGLVNGLSGLQ